MKYASIVLALFALVMGLIAARYWYKSSKVAIGPTGLNWGLPGTGALIEPFLPEQKALEMSVVSMMDDQAIIGAIKAAGGLNQIAALWTAASVVLAALSSVVGTLS